ncbi:hypothetical protein ACWCPG_36030, partial [Streptomyces sp. NPDC001919]
MTTTGRRALLTAGASAAAAALAGCTSAGDQGPRKPDPAAREAERVARAEAALRLRSVTASRTLLERYDAALAAHPALAPRLSPLRRSVAVVPVADPLRLAVAQCDVSHVLPVVHAPP